MSAASPLLEAALSYAARGWRVLPLHSMDGDACTCGDDGCSSAGKHPRSAHGSKDASANPDRIRGWWRAWPDANIGIATGEASGLVVLDVDPRHGGNESLRELVEEHGELSGPAVVTGSGGLHLLFRHPGGTVRNSAGTLGRGLDLRGDGGYVVAAPSVHASGRCYAWAPGRNPAEVELAAMPPWLLERASATRKRQTSGPIQVIELPSEARLRRARAWLSRRDPAVEGSGGDHHTFLTACELRGFGLDEDETFALLFNEWNHRCSPPWEPEDLRAKVRNAYRYATGTPGEKLAERQATPMPAQPKPKKEAQMNNAAPVHNIVAGHFTETGNAKRLAALHGADLRFCHPWGKWLVWDGTRWREDDTGEAMRRAKDTVRALYDAVASVDEADLRRKLADWARKSDSASKLSAMLRLAESEPGIPVLPDDFDRDPFLFSAANGTVDLRTGKLRPHHREDLITKAADVSFDEKATCPTWEAFLDRVLAGDADLIRFVQKLCGYVLTGSTQEQAVFFLYGHGANGKSVFLRVLQALLGDYCVQAPPSLLVAANSDTHPTELARLFGQRLAICTELERGARLAESRVKQLSGEDKIAARRMREDFWEFQSTAKLVIASNYKPEIRGTDEGIWRRQRLIPFDVTIPVEERDPYLFEKLLDELPGILRWAVDGCQMWMTEGLEPPEAVRAATDDYRAEQDVLHDFLEACCAFTPGTTVTKARLRSVYEAWARANAADAIGNREFRQRLMSRPEVGEARNKVAKSWTGIELTTEGERLAREAETHQEFRRAG